MNAYADASLLVPLFVRDAFNDRARRFVAEHRPTLLVSDFAAAEFASALALRVRIGDLAADEARAAFWSLDEWLARHGSKLETTSSDVTVAEAFLRRLDLGLRTPDALNIAIARRHDAALATFDVRMSEAARVVGLEVAPA